MIILYYQLPLLVFDDVLLRSDILRIQNKLNFEQSRPEEEITIGRGRLHLGGISSLQKGKIRKKSNLGYLHMGSE